MAAFCHEGDALAGSAGVEGYSEQEEEGYSGAGNRELSGG